MSNGDLFAEMMTDMTVKDILSFPSGLYTSGDLVIMRQEGIGFSKKELMVLKFAESDIDRAMQEGEENV